VPSPAKVGQAIGNQKEAAAGSKCKAPESDEDAADAEETEKNSDDAEDAETISPHTLSRHPIVLCVPGYKLSTKPTVLLCDVDVTEL